MSDTQQAPQQCEFCDKPAEFLSTSEQCGGQGYEAWPTCAEHIGNQAELLTATGIAEGQLPMNVVMVARIANATDAESVELQSKRLFKMADAENNLIEGERLYDRLIRDFNATASDRSSTRALTISAEEIGVVLTALRKARQL